MLNNEQEEKLVQILIDRINALNEDILTTIGNRIKQIGELTPTQVHQIQQMLMYDTDIETIVKKLEELTNMKLNDIYNMFEYSAKTNQDFAKQFYKARGISYIPYAQNKALKEQIKAIEEIEEATPSIDKLLNDDTEKEKEDKEKKGDKVND